MAPPEPPLVMPVSRCGGNVGIAKCLGGYTYFLRGAVKVLRGRERLAARLYSPKLEVHRHPNAPKQAFPGAQNGATEAENGENPKISLRRRRL